MAPDVNDERRLRGAGYQHIAGIDEAGRGCWAGPVVAAAVVLAPSVLAAPALLAGVDDSKALSERQRETHYRQIVQLSEGIGIGIVPAYVIDAWNILHATRLAMTIAILSLPVLPDALLIDAVVLDTTSLHQESLVRGDSRSLSIAAASIVAKVTRDHLMDTAALVYPSYGFGRHKGYGTTVHRAALHTSGPCALHRKTYRPVAECLYS